MAKIYIGQEEIMLNNEAYNYLASVIINYPFINQIEFVLDDLYISPDLEENTLYDIFSVMFLALKLYGDYYLKASGNIPLSWIRITHESLGAVESPIINNSYKQMIKLDRLCDELNTLMGYQR